MMTLAWSQSTSQAYGLDTEVSSTHPEGSSTV